MTPTSTDKLFLSLYSIINLVLSQSISPQDRAQKTKNRGAERVFQTAHDFKLAAQQDRKYDKSQLRQTKIMLMLQIAFWED